MTDHTPTSSPRRFRAGLPLLVPPLYLLVALALQPSDRLGDPAPPVELGRLLYDDYDSTAMALRGLNAQLGRSAGVTDAPPPLTPEAFDEALDDGRPPTPRYFLEYPHAALLLFRLPWLWRDPGPASAWPAALLDGCHNNVREHLPRDDGERGHWSQLRRATQWYAAAMAVCLVGLMVVLRAGYEPGGTLGGAVWLLILPGALYFSLWRFDVLPALLTALSFACLGRRRDTLSGALLAAAVLVKVYPILLAPLLARSLLATPGRALRWSAGFAAAGAAGAGLTLAVVGWEAMIAPYRFQLGRPPEFGWTAYGILLPERLSAPGTLGSLFRTGSVVAVVLLLCIGRPAGLAGVLRRSALVLIPFVGLQVFYSPQWILWLSPLLIPLAARSRAVLGLTVALDLLTFLSFPLLFDNSSRCPVDLVPLSVWARYALLLTLAIVLARQEYRATRAGRPDAA